MAAYHIQNCVAIFYVSHFLDFVRGASITKGDWCSSRSSWETEGGGETPE